jgi:hypothetical protein
LALIDRPAAAAAAGVPGATYHDTAEAEIAPLPAVPKHAPSAEEKAFDAALQPVQHI